MNACGHSPKSHVGSARGGSSSIRRMMLVVVAALALSAIVPALASAQTTWALNYQPVSKSTAVEWNGQLRMNDTTVPQDVECTEKAEGSVGTAGAGEVTKLTVSKCTGVKGCEKKETGTTIIPRNLPWHTELVLVGGALDIRLVNGGKGTPGFKDECIIGGALKLADECSGAFSATLTNAESGVTAAFNNSEKLTCTEGGAVSGIVEGSQSVTASGGTLSAQKEEPVWLKGGLPLEGEAKLTEWSKGTISLYAPGGGGTFGVRCEDSGEGTAAAAGAGTITKFTMTKCERAPFESVCDGKYSLEATHLPWKTELYFGLGGLVGEFFTQNGAGVPDIKMECEWGSKSGVITECEGAHMGKITNNTEQGVLAELAEGGLSCSGLRSGARLYESHQTINLTSGQTLHVS